MYDSFFARRSSPSATHQRPSLRRSAASLGRKDWRIVARRASCELRRRHRSACSMATSPSWRKPRLQTHASILQAAYRKSFQPLSGHHSTWKRRIPRQKGSARPKLGTSGTRNRRAVRTNRGISTGVGRLHGSAMAPPEKPAESAESSHCTKTL